MAACQPWRQWGIARVAVGRRQESKVSNRKARKGSQSSLCGAVVVVVVVGRRGECFLERLATGQLLDAKWQTQRDRGGVPWTSPVTG